ncbi:hypothetical protein SPV1_09593 [Mariprofundus ferrooxydans PV-1]|uniref:Uncharacterized protein n=1 Tax=Mariprofundus ferrooxydans PV-1 TaxID=314345 RepID=Q0EZU6_9PROT|nr:hypothetical protein SPV1_09593 [Mariprofundus ferrooxydans PV-1]
MLRQTKLLICIYVKAVYDFIVIRGAVYFSLVFAVGFILGVIRVTWIVPQFGERAAELMEAPLMLAAIYVAARFVTRRFRALRVMDYLYSGLIALLLLLTVEFSVVLGLRGLSIREYLEARDPVAGAVYVMMLIIFAVMPWLVGNRHTAA